MKNEIDHARSYNTEVALRQRLEQHDLLKYHPVIVRNRAGRFTAIFSAARIYDGNAFGVAKIGFKVI